MQIVNLDVFGNDKEELAKVLDSLKLQLPPQEIEGINRISTALRDYAFGDIKKVAPGDNVLATFILCSCFVEQMATYRYGTDNVGPDHFKDFVGEYMKDYDGFKLRRDLRNKLVHNYSLGETYSLTMRSPNAHLKKDINGTIILNLENFVNDLGVALEAFLRQLIVDIKIRKLAFKVLSKNHIIGMSNIDYVNYDSHDLIK